MTKLPDGHVFIYRLMMTKIKVEERELVMCKHCKHGEEVNSVYLCGKTRGFGIAHEPGWFCADGEREDAENH